MFLISHGPARTGACHVLFFARPAGLGGVMFFISRRPPPLAASCFLCRGGEAWRRHDSSRQAGVMIFRASRPAGLFPDYAWNQAKVGNPGRLAGRPAGRPGRPPDFCSGRPAGPPAGVLSGRPAHFCRLAGRPFIDFQRQSWRKPGCDMNAPKITNLASDIFQ